MKHLRIFFFSILVINSFSCATPREASDSTKLVHKANSLVERLIKEDFSAVETDFGVTMKTGLPPSKLQDAWKDLLTRVGAFKKVLTVKRGELQQYDVVFVLCEFERAKIQVQVVFDDGGQVAGLYFLTADH
ncbi:MAG: DUF3887 domain-containing protein [Pyrinomonadaceae bacterium]